MCEIFLQSLCYFIGFHKQKLFIASLKTLGSQPYDYFRMLILKKGDIILQQNIILSQHLQP